MTGKQFPTFKSNGQRPASTWSRTSVPWGFVAPHEAQALKNHGQTLQRLAERGGLSPSELYCVVTDQEWKWWTTIIPYAEIEAELTALLMEYERKEANK